MAMGQHPLAHEQDRLDEIAAIFGVRLPLLKVADENCLDLAPVLPAAPAHIRMDETG